MAGRYVLGPQLDDVVQSGVAAAGPSRQVAVHEAVDRILGRPVIVTLIRDAPEAVDATLALLGRVAQVEHRHLEPLLLLRREDDFGVVVTERPGERVLADAAGRVAVLDPLLAVSVARQVGAALDHLHAAGFVHGAVSPHSVTLDPPVHPREAGVARLGRIEAVRPAPDQPKPFDLPDPSIGDPSYAAPEQLEAGAAPTAASDLYALGALVFALLTSTPPFPLSPVMSEDERQRVRARQAAGETPAIAASRPPSSRPVPHAVDATLRRALAVDPAARFPDARTFVEALVTATRSPDRPVEAPAEKPAPSRRRRRLLAAALVLLGVMAVAGFFFLRWRSAPEPERASTWSFVAEPLASGCGPTEGPPDELLGARDAVRCSAPGPIDEVTLVRFRSTASAKEAVGQLLRQRAADIVPCSAAPLPPDFDHPSATACLATGPAGAEPRVEMVWVVRGRHVVGVASARASAAAGLERWLRYVSPALIRETR